MSEKYIRGWRQLKAIRRFFECLLNHNPFWSRMKCASRELLILTGFAKPYKIMFAPSFWESLEIVAEEEGIQDKEAFVQHLKTHFVNKYGAKSEEN